MTKKLTSSPIGEKSYDRAPAVVHSNDMAIVADVIEKRRFSELRVKGGKGSKRRQEDTRAVRHNWYHIRWK